MAFEMTPKILPDMFQFQAVNRVRVSTPQYRIGRGST